MKRLFCTLFLVILFDVSFDDGMRAQSPLSTEIDRRAPQVLEKVVRWRRDFHEHPELGNRETRTAKIVADHLRSLGIEVRTNVAHTGVVGVLRGGPSTSLGAGKPGPSTSLGTGKVVALRADMDALPVTEQVNLPFASKVKATHNGQDTRAATTIMSRFSWASLNCWPA